MGSSYPNVWSSQFILYTDSTPNLSYAVPEGFTAVIREITAICELGGLTGTCSIQNDEEATPVVVYYFNMLSVFAYSEKPLRVVVPGGGFITLQLSALDLASAIYVGGYLLRGDMP